MRKMKEQSGKDLTAGLFRDNEVKTNKLAAGALLAMGLFFIVRVGTGEVTPYGLGNRVCEVLMFIAGLINLGIFAVAKGIGFKNKWLKWVVLGGVLMSSGLGFFLYPMNSSFIVYGPIIISAMYYEPRLIRRTAVFTFVMYSSLLWANVLLEKEGTFLYELHKAQEVTVWRMPIEILVNYQITHLIYFAITTAICMAIAIKGRRMVNERAETASHMAAMETELSAATKIQLASIPPKEYSTKGGEFKIRAMMRPAKTVGGDFYEYYLSGSNLVFMVADVSDKGMAAAMFMMKAKNAIRASARNGESIEEAISEANLLLCEDNQESMFVSAWVAYVNIYTGAGRFINCGHIPPIIKHGDGTVTRIECEANTLLGLFEEAEFVSQSFELDTNDTLLVFTDGFTDATNSAGDFFSDERLFKVAADMPKDVPNPCGYLAAAVDVFAGGSNQFDDMTLMAVRREDSFRGVEKTLSLPASLESAELVIDAANEVLAQLDCPEDDRRNFDVVIDEICCNIAEYAYPEGGGTIGVKISSGEGWTAIRFTDTGLPFNPLEQAEPELTDVPRIGGLGISLVRKLMDSVEYCRSNGQNRLYLFKKW